MKIASPSMVLLTEAVGRDASVDCLLRTWRQPNDFEWEMLSAGGCTFLSGSAGTAVWVRLHARDANQILNLGFVEEVEVVGKESGSPDEPK
jgi:hypothetical protein